MKPWSKDEIIYLENYEDEYLNVEASKRFYNLYRDIISEEDKDSYISVNDAIKIYNLKPREYIEEKYTIIKRTTPLTTSGINKIKCTMLMSVGIMCGLSMFVLSKKNKEKVCSNLTKTFNEYIEDNSQFDLISKKVKNFDEYFNYILSK